MGSLLRFRLSLLLGYCRLYVQPLFSTRPKLAFCLRHAVSFCARHHALMHVNKLCASIYHRFSWVTEVFVHSGLRKVELCFHSIVILIIVHIPANISRGCSLLHRCHILIVPQGILLVKHTLMILIRRAQFWSNSIFHRVCLVFTEFIKVIHTAPILKWALFGWCFYFGYWLIDCLVSVIATIEFIIMVGPVRLHSWRPML